MATLPADRYTLPLPVYISAGTPAATAMLRVAPGASANFTVTATSGATTHSAQLVLIVDPGAPNPAKMVTPADGSHVVGNRTRTFNWNAGNAAQEYQVDVGYSGSTPFFSQSGITTQQIDVPLPPIAQSPWLEVTLPTKLPGPTWGIQVSRNPFRISPRSVAIPPHDPPAGGDRPPRVRSLVRGQTTRLDWYIWDGSQASAITSCRLDPPDDVTIAVSVDNQDPTGSHYWETYTVGPSAALGARNDLCTSTQTTPAETPGYDYVAIVANPAPQITSLSPNYGLAGSTANVIITGTDLDTVQTALISGYGCPGASCGLSVILGAVSPTSLEMSITAASTTKSGAYGIAVASPNGQSATWTFNVFDGSPVINYITQSAIQSGQQGSISIYGDYFGTGCNGNLPCTGAGITICPTGTTCSTSDVHPAVQFWSDTQINAQVTADSSANGSYDVVVTSAGTAGQGFAPGPGKTAQSAAKQITVNGNPHLTLRVTTNNGDAAGGVLSITSGTGTNDCAYVSSTPSMPQVTAQITTDDPANNPITGSTNWYADLSFGYKIKHVSTNVVYPDIRQITTSGLTQPSNQTRTISWPADVLSAPWGGNVSIHWTYNGQSQIPFYFRICRRNPSSNDVDALLITGGFWGGHNVTVHETSESQFCEQRSLGGECTTSVLGLPFFGSPPDMASCNWTRSIHLTRSGTGGPMSTVGLASSSPIISHHWCPT